MRKKPVTQLEIASKLKVSRVTVSKALRDHPDISDAMKAKVIKAAEEMGYFPNLVASNLSTRKTNTIGVVIPDLENSFFAYLTDSIIDTATENDLRVILTVSRETPEIESKNIRTLIGMRVDGLLVCVSQTTSDREIFTSAEKLGIPLVFFDRTIKYRGTSQVIFDDRNGTRSALEVLIKGGYRKMAHFAGYQKSSIGRERCNSLRKTLENNGLPVKKEWIIEGGFEVDDGYRAFQKLKSAGAMPELILAVNDRVALGIYKAAAEAGMKIPGDIAVAGYGFSESAGLFNPPLAVINQDPRLMGVRATRQLISEINGISKGGARILIGEEFIWDKSVRLKNSNKP
jgi:LacI family transcriptional regulator